MCTCINTIPSVSFYMSLDSVKLHYPATNKKKRREYVIYVCHTPFPSYALYLQCHTLLSFISLSLSKNTCFSNPLEKGSGRAMAPCITHCLSISKQTAACTTKPSDRGKHFSSVTTSFVRAPDWRDRPPVHVGNQIRRT